MYVWEAKEIKTGAFFFLCLSLSLLSSPNPNLCVCSLTCFFLCASVCLNNTTQHNTIQTFAAIQQNFLLFVNNLDHPMLNGRSDEFPSNLLTLIACFVRLVCVLER